MAVNHQPARLNTRCSYLRSRDHYGARRGPDPQHSPTSTGFLNQHEDTTGLTYLNNRYHDPHTGGFISVDPMVSTTFEPYIYAASNPINKSDPSGLCAGADVFDYCVLNDGTVVDQGTTRLAPVTKLAGVNQRSVANWIDQMQTGDPDASSGSGDSFDAARELFARAVRNGTVVPNSNGGYMLGRCAGEDWCDVYWHSPISESLLGVPSTALDQMVDMQVLLSASLLTWPGAGVVSVGVCSFSADTEVLMADGSTKPISLVGIGDWVIAADPQTGERGARQVTHVWMHADTLVDLNIGGGSVTTTEDHPFWNATDQAWQDARRLDPGDFVMVEVLVSLTRRTGVTATSILLVIC